jgi:hypothetical protein
MGWIVPKLCAFITALRAPLIFRSGCEHWLRAVIPSIRRCCNDRARCLGTSRSHRAVMRALLLADTQSSQGLSAVGVAPVPTASSCNCDIACANRGALTTKASER